MSSGRLEEIWRDHLGMTWWLVTEWPGRFLRWTAIEVDDDGTTYGTHRVPDPTPEWTRLGVMTQWGLMLGETAACAPTSQSCRDASLPGGERPSVASGSSSRGYLSSCGQWFFVLAGPSKPHRYVRVPALVWTTECPYPGCGAAAGAACHEDGRPKTDVHYHRRWKARRGD